ncbi:Transcription factor Ouib [Amphibalanus amphitrite]|uniref:Transcription factor Ouib n=1 Tax=Amphibalanus amphitrite TaxID=1232801 RepID=A0A6A4WXR7_AMPAM|nr:Transcription factor Ouib [Amphibalanus amphitrite]
MSAAGLPPPPPPPPAPLADGARRRHVCPECGKEFRAATSLYHHMPVHRGLTTCPLCGRVYSRRPDLVNHLRQVHELSWPPPGASAGD